jgi:hypothetical protein
LPVEPGPRRSFGGRDLGVATGPLPRGDGRFGASWLDRAAVLRQGAALLLTLALVLLALPGFSPPAQAAGLRLYLHNYPTPPSGDTNGTRALPMDTAAPTATTLYDYNVDVFSGRSGRYVHRGSANGPGEADLRYMINWVFQVPQDMVLDGSATGGIWVTHKDGCVHTGSFRLWLRTKHNAMTDTGTLIGSGTGAVPPGPDEPCWNLSGVSIPVSTTIPAGTWLELKLTVDDADRDAAMVAYDTISFASYLDLPLAEATPTPTPTPATPNPEPATPTPEPATPTPEPATPTPDPATPTPDPATPTPDPATPTPEPPTPTPPPPAPTPPPPTPEPPTPEPTPEPPTPTPPPPTPDPTWWPTDPPPTPTPEPTTEPTPDATPTPEPTPEPTATPTSNPIPTVQPPARPHETPFPLGELETPPPPPASSSPPAPAAAPPAPPSFPPPADRSPLAPVATAAPRPPDDEDPSETRDPNDDGVTGTGAYEPRRQLIDLVGGGTGAVPGADEDDSSAITRSLARLASTAGEAVQRFAFPLSLTILVLLFLLVQGEIDRRDPKLAFAPVDSSKDMVYFQ